MLKWYRTRRVAVARAELGARLVRAVLRYAAVLLHLDKVERAVEAARQVRRVDRERELLVEQIEPAMGGKQAV